MILRMKLPFTFLVMPFLALLITKPIHAAQDLEGGIQEVAQQLSAAMGSGKVKKLAIVEFPDLNGYQSALGQFIAEELITQLSIGANAGQFDVVERRQLARVLQEQELTDSSLFDAQSISKIGKILGIDAIVTGSIADLGTDVKINARAISIETAKVFAAAATKIPKTDTVLQLMRQNAGPASQGAVSAATGLRLTQVQRAGLFFQNSFLRIDVISFTISKDNKKAILSLSIENITSQDIYLATDGCDGSTLIDSSGAVVPEGSKGRVFVTGLQCGYADLVATLAAYEDERRKFARFEPGTKTPVVFTFQSTEETVFAGNLFTFSAEMLDLVENKARRFTVGISGIELLN